MMLNGAGGIALQPTGLSKFCKKYGIAQNIGNQKTYSTKLFVFTALEMAHFKIFYKLQENFIFLWGRCEVLTLLF